MPQTDQAHIQWCSAEVENGVRIRYLSAGTGLRVVLLIHGYPETAIAWRHLVGPLVHAAYRVIAPDIRGAGGSSRPLTGYDKVQLAQDCLLVLKDAGVSNPVCVVGHDIGLMIAYAFARRFRESTRALVVMDAPLPGTEAFDQISLNSQRVWHFHFHQAPDIPEALTAGREAFYLERFWHDLAYDAGAIDSITKQSYVESFSGPGGMRAGFELYRTFSRDADWNRAVYAREGKLSVPVLTMSGEASAFEPIMENMMLEVAANVTAVTILRAGHWLAEENPIDVAQAIINFDKLKVGNC
ncbi:alpha/beta hydrolase [Pseudomonas sp. USTB-Z]|uniref:alpha/beta fold hydrolase n=1 Tax=Pseudomonas sp. USTB-Z TaxID=2794351 RepID=UPI001C83DE7F|nr:alpha/beta hydrolase [Pseudomonas sp. USTB-Z]MBX6689229.1 alpha/beta hydrolase [Pseudomonas sp. USTB-Z]